MVSRFTAGVVAALGPVVGTWGMQAAQAQLVPANSAVITTRIFNDDPNSTLTFTDTYPALINIDDSMLDGDGMDGEFANLHGWSLSTDNTTAASFNNNSGFSLSADLVIAGEATSQGEAGLRISPWWSQDVDGRFNVRVNDGEVAAFGGRLPFYSFTAQHGVSYVKGTTITLGVVYDPNELTASCPATIEYTVVYAGACASGCSSGPLPFDQGNPAEDPPHGLWGILNDARVGGHFQPFLQPGDPTTQLEATWSNIEYTSGPLLNSCPAVSSAGWVVFALSMVGVGAMTIRKRSPKVDCLG